MVSLFHEQDGDLLYLCDYLSHQSFMFFLYGDRESVVQALKTATRNFWQYWLAIVAAVLFFGGLLVKSYWEGYVFERDYKRLLKYYHHVTPGSINDGDVDGDEYEEA